MKLLQLLENMNEEDNPDIKVKKKGQIYHAYLKGQHVGQALVYDHQDDKVGDDERYIWKAKVHPDYQRRGVASAMYDVITADLKSQGLKLVPSPNNQLSPDGYQFWKDRDSESIKGHGRHKAEAYDKHIGTELDIEGRTAIVTKIGWSARKDVPLIFFRYTDVPEGSVNSTSVVSISVVADQLSEDEKIELPDLETGDELMVGKFKNRKATIKGFKKDKNNQPVAKTNKGDQQIFKGRVKKLMDRTTEGALNTDAVFEYNLMEKFAQSDVDNLYWFWAHPASGQIYHLVGTHTTGALEPDSPLGLTPEDFGGYDNVDIDDNDVFEAAFRKGWVRSSYMRAEGAHPLGDQVGLHGADEEAVRMTLSMLLDKGLEVDYAGLRGHYDKFEYDGPVDGL